MAGMSASRQKNCNNCVMAKRRCDRRMPVCSRCTEKNMPCIYAKTKTASRSSQQQSVGLSAYMDPSSFGSPAGSSIFAPGLALDVDFLGNMPVDAELSASGSAESTHNNLVLDLNDDGDIPMDPFLNMMDNDSTQWLATLDQRPVVERRNSLADEEVLMAYEKMTPVCDNIEPWHLYDPKTPLHYVYNRVKDFTTDIATRNAAPFLHRYLYKDHTPQCILSCFTTSVLYMNRTKANTSMVMRALHSNVRELIDAETNRIIATPTDKLARTQTLFLYQVMRLFDGDVSLRAGGEQDMPLLHTWLSELCRVRENLGDLAELENGLVRQQTPQEWERWIFAESLRRTIVMAYSVIQLYDMMKNSDREDEGGPWSFVHRWTLSRHLWDADSSYEFKRMWKEKPQFIISNYSFAKFIEYGRGDDVDEFAEILLSIYMGVDETKEFMSAKGTVTKSAS